MPGHAGEKRALPKSVDASGLLPDDHDYYRYNGSMTTPPFAEGVSWRIMKNIHTVSEEQVEKFTQTMHHPNNRPVQSVNARAILK